MAAVVPSRPVRRSGDDFPPVFGSAPRAAAPRLTGRRATWQVAVGALLVMAIAAFNLFYKLGEPAQPIWDESYYLTSTARYELGQAQFASHPPLGLMLIAAGDHVSGANRSVEWPRLAADKKIAGEDMPAGFSYFGVRCASALFGVLAAGLFFLLAAALVGSSTGALLLTSPFLFDTALIAQFRAAQLDSFQLCFAVAALLCLARGERRPGAAGWIVGFGVACGLAAMVRANGILLLAAAALPCLRALLADGAATRRLLGATRAGALAVAGAGVAMLAVFGAHLAVAPRAMPATWPAAQTDARFVAAPYRDWLDGRASFSPAVLVAAADGYRRFMASDVAGVGRSDANGSSPLAWPFSWKPIVYRWDSDGATTAYVALAPNRAGWAVSLAGLFVGLATAAAGLTRRGRAVVGSRAPLAAALVLLWLAFMLSDLLLAAVRVMYLYHYFVPLVLGWALAALAYPLAEQRWPQRTPRVATAMLALILANFTLLAPFALHRPMSDRGCLLRAFAASPILCEHAVK